MKYILCLALCLSLLACTNPQTPETSSTTIKDSTLTQQLDTIPAAPPTPADTSAISFATLNPRDLISTYFNEPKFKADEIATYEYNGDPMEVKYVGEQAYQENGINYVLTFFENYDLDQQGKRDWACHACSGKLSVAKFRKEEGKLIPIDFTYDCPCGTANMGGVAVPKVVLIGDRHFLEKSVADMGQGISIELLYYYDIKDYTELLQLTTAENNEADAPSKEQAYNYQATISHSKDSPESTITVQYSGTTYAKDLSVIPHNTKEVYLYNTEQQKFIKQ